MSHQRPAAMAAALAMVAVIAAGCGRRVEFVPVEGRVMLDGRPLTRGGIMLQPTAGPAASGRIDAEGRFRMTTYRPGDGVIAGPAAVRVTSFEKQPVDEEGRDREPAHGKTLIPERYQDFQASGIVIEVVRGMRPVTVELSTR